MIVTYVVIYPVNRADCCSGCSVFLLSSNEKHHSNHNQLNCRSACFPGIELVFWIWDRNKFLVPPHSWVGWIFWPDDSAYITFHWNSILD